MSKRTNEELLARHEAGLSVYKSDEVRLRHLIAAAYANTQSERLKIEIDNASNGGASP